MSRPLPVGPHYALRTTGAVSEPTIELIDRKTSLVIATMADDWARRIMALFERRARGEVSDAQYNCFAAVRHVLGHTDVLQNEQYMQAQGNAFDRSGTLEHVPIPGVVQIHAGIVEYDEDMGIYPVGSKDIVSHAALVIAHHAKEPIVFQKFCQQQLEILPLRDVLRFYFDMELPTGAYDATALPADALLRI